VDVRIQVSGIAGIADLADDLRTIPVMMRSRATAIVARNIDYGNKTAQNIANQLAGKHGKNYANRLTAEMTGPLSGVYGPSPLIGEDYVGVGGTEGAMRDLEKSASTTAPKFAREIGEMVDGLFWPGG
jgi:hypothetical protein